MSRVHDMGGRFGDGPVQPEAQGVAEFKQDWHKGAMALTIAAGALGKWNIDMGRHAREKLTPQDYARFTYYEKWIAALADILVETGVVTRRELAAGQGDKAKSDAPGLSGATMAKLLAQGGPSLRESDMVPAFKTGQLVRARHPGANRLVDGGHNRLPQYCAGATGRIARYHGCHVLPDSNAHGLGEAPEPLYTVVFTAAELWAAPEHPDDEVTMDLWQSYLEPA